MHDINNANVSFKVLTIMFDFNLYFVFCTAKLILWAAFELIFFFQLYGFFLLFRRRSFCKILQKKVGKLTMQPFSNDMFTTINTQNIWQKSYA